MTELSEPYNFKNRSCPDDVDMLPHTIYLNDILHHACKHHAPSFPAIGFSATRSRAFVQRVSHWRGMLVRNLMFWFIDEIAAIRETSNYGSAFPAFFICWARWPCTVSGLMQRATQSEHRIGCVDRISLLACSAALDRICGPDGGVALWLQHTVRR